MAKIYKLFYAISCRIFILIIFQSFQQLSINDGGLSSVVSDSIIDHSMPTALQICVKHLEVKDLSRNFICFINALVSNHNKSTDRQRWVLVSQFEKFWVCHL